MQLAIIVGITDMTILGLNEFLMAGWKIASNSPMGVGLGTGATRTHRWMAVSLVVIEKEELDENDNKMVEDYLGGLESMVKDFEKDLYKEE